MANKEQDLTKNLSEESKQSTTPNPDNRPDNDLGAIDNPPLGNAADPTASVADEKAVNKWSITPEERDQTMNIDELHTLGVPDQERRGALGKTDPNLGQDTPLGGADAEGRKKDAA